MEKIGVLSENQENRNQEKAAAIQMQYQYRFIYITIPVPAMQPAQPNGRARSLSPFLPPPVQFKSRLYAPQIWRSKFHHLPLILPVSQLPSQKELPVLPLSLSLSHTYRLIVVALSISLALVLYHIARGPFHYLFLIDPFCYFFDLSLSFLGFFLFYCVARIRFSPALSKFI